jgi:hypothetical protein
LRLKKEVDMIDYDKAKLEGVLNDIAQIVYKKYDEASVQLTYHRTDPDNADGLEISYRDNVVGIISRDHGNRIKVRSNYDQRYSFTDYRAEKIYGSKKEFNRVVTNLKRKLKHAVQMVDDNIAADKAYRAKSKSLVDSLIEQGFTDKEVENSSYGSVDLTYNGKEYSIFRDSKVDVEIPTDKLKAVLDLIAQ